MESHHPHTPWTGARPMDGPHGGQLALIHRLRNKADLHGNASCSLTVPRRDTRIASETRSRFSLSWNT